MAKQNQQDKKHKKSEEKKLTKFRGKYMKYTGMGFELMGAILLGWWIGGMLDEYFENEKATATAFCMLFFLVASMTKTILGLIKDSKK
jgi:F0F1-type ATP synthase assembly protein I